jgi:cytochrome bd ubiquinol oxidase subunit II
MAELWYAIAASMLTAYVVLDGFDFGAGTLHLFVAKTDTERRQVLAAIGPYWDGNEVWLLATGGVLFVAFPAVLASGLSGFYFAIFLVLWLLILRGISIEFRSHLPHALWRSAWDAGFSGASVLLPVLFGAALGNLVRGLPLDERGWFSLALFTDFLATPPVGILDWYTLSAGVFAGLAIAMHGATFLAWKTTGPVHDRSRTLAARLFVLVALLWPVLTIATAYVNAPMLAAAARRPLAWVAILAALAGLTVIWRSLRSGHMLRAFLGSCAFLAGMLGATAASLFPALLRAIDDDSLSLTAYNASVPGDSLRIAFRWWIVGFPLAVTYFVVLFRHHRGTVAGATGRDGY